MCFSYNMDSHHLSPPINSWCPPLDTIPSGSRLSHRCPPFKHTTGPPSPHAGMHLLLVPSLSVRVWRIFHPSLSLSTDYLSGILAHPSAWSLLLDRLARQSKAPPGLGVGPFYPIVTLVQLFYKCKKIRARCKVYSMVCVMPFHGNGIMVYRSARPEPEFLYF